MLPMGVGISFFILRTKFLTQAFKRIAEHVDLIHEVRPNFGVNAYSDSSIWTERSLRGQKKSLVF